MPAAAHLTLYLVFGMAAGGAAGTAAAQDALGLFGHGAEAKAHAGAGLLASRNAPANYYNPANLALAPQGVEAYGDLSIVSLSYGYAYPGLDPVLIDQTIPIPFLGVSFAPDMSGTFLKTLAFAFSVLPIPASSGGREIKNLPTKRFATDRESKPVLLDVETKGEGVGWRASFGVGARVVSGFELGLSVLWSTGKSSFVARDSDTGDVLTEDKSDVSTIAAIIGSRGSLMGGKLTMAVAIKPPSVTDTVGTTTFPSLDPDAVAEKDGKDKGPWSLGLGVSGKVTETIVPFLEYQWSKWSALRRQPGQQLFDTAEHDYFDTHDITLGLDWTVSKHRFTGAIARYQSPIGDGIMDFESADETELIGMEFQNIDGMPRMVYAGGWRLPLPWAEKAGSLQTGLSYTRGTRDVWYKARGYGNYDLVIIQLFGGGEWRF